VEVALRYDNGSELPIYPAAAGPSGTKVYAEAIKGDNYKIVLRNRLNRRVGVVVAVDGRNIISGEKSWLGRNERMYILEAHEEQEYSGWRTGDDRVNRFYFTTSADSYAGAFKDESAMGVIAVAVYQELRFQAYSEMRGPTLPQLPMEAAPKPVPAPSSGDNFSAAPSLPAPASPKRFDASPSHSAPAAKESARAPRAGASSAQREQRESAEREESAGTGYGASEYSPVRLVEFEPDEKALEKVLIRYEWRATLCKKGVIACGTTSFPANRLWDGDGYAPPPPGRN
jgi:hypothetical protein